MQLAWFKTADLYIGQGLIMLKQNAEATHVFEHAPTMPLDRVLAMCNGLVKKGTKLKVTLSSSLCVALNIQILPSVVRLSELKVFLSASTGQQLHTPSTQFDCVINLNSKSVNKSLVAAVPISVRSTIDTWIRQQDCTMITLQPLWSVATHSAACQHTSIKGLVLHEPDGSILVAETKNDELQTMSWQSHLAPDAVLANLRRALVSFDMVEQDVLSLRFAAKPLMVMKNPPAVWSSHWDVTV